MPESAQMNGIKNSWSLISFAKSHGKLKIADLKNAETNEEYTGLAFVSEGNAPCFVNFSTNLGVLSPSEIVARQHELQVVELNVAPEVAARRAAKGRQAESYCLCAMGNQAWQDVDLDI